jgi:hypothetical protein
MVSPPGVFHARNGFPPLRAASNVSLGRLAGGVHYRTDGVEGVKLGEEIALSILREHGDHLPRGVPGIHSDAIRWHASHNLSELSKNAVLLNSGLSNSLLYRGDDGVDTLTGERQWRR